MSRQQKVEAQPSPEGPDESADLSLQLIDLRIRLDKVADLEARELSQKAQREPTHKELCCLACRIYDARRTRDRMMDHQLFGEPAWDMLLSLYCLPGRGERLTITALNYASNVKQSTGLRWQAILTEAKLIERGPKEVDARKQFVRLTDSGRALLTDYLTRLFYCNTPVPPKTKQIG